MGHLPFIEVSGCFVASLPASAVHWVHVKNVVEEMERKEAICRPPLWSTPATATSLPSPEGKKVMSTESDEFLGSWMPMGDLNLWGR